MASLFNFEVELKNIILAALRVFEFSHRLGQYRKKPAYSITRSMRALNVGGNSNDAAPHQSPARQGDYLFKCRDCKDRTCIGDKRAIMCADCAYALPDGHGSRNIATDKPAQSVR